MNQLSKMMGVAWKIPSKNKRIWHRFHRWRRVCAKTSRSGVYLLCIYALFIESQVNADKSVSSGIGRGWDSRSNLTQTSKHNNNNNNVREGNESEWTLFLDFLAVWGLGILSTARRQCKKDTYSPSLVILQANNRCTVCYFGRKNGHNCTRYRTAFANMHSKTNNRVKPTSFR